MDAMCKNAKMSDMNQLPWRPGFLPLATLLRSWPMISRLRSGTKMILISHSVPSALTATDKHETVYNMMNNKAVTEPSLRLPRAYVQAVSAG